ncbi:MAG: hypothetical protein P4M00_15875 [Azospirillaceae bacterium]|nr:hypothetical protein [Azospirillaceae bacterium]
MDKDDSTAIGRDRVVVDLAASAADLLAVALSITDAAVTAEQALIEVGNDLGDAITTVSGLTTNFDVLSGRLAGPDVDVAVGHLAEVGAALAAIADALAGECAALDSLADLARTIAGRGAHLQNTIATISVLAINARIAAAQITEDNEDFSVFTMEIGHLAAVATETVGRFASELQSLFALLTVARDGQVHFERTHAASLRTVARQLNDSQHAVNQHRSRTATAAAGIGNSTKRIAAAIGEAVMALQIGDITKQRIEHISHALTLLSRALAAPNPGEVAADWTRDLTPDQRQAVIATVCRLQIAQINQTTQDFNREIKRVSEALKGIASEANDMVHRGADLYGAEGHRDQSFLVVLANDLRQSDTLIRSSQLERRHVDQVVERAKQTLLGLVTQIKAVRRVEVDMRLVGLNTTFKCGRLGAKGRTLSAIAEELRASAAEIVIDAQDIMTGLDAFVAQANALEQQKTGQGANRIALLEGTTEAALASLDKAGDSLTAALATLQTGGATVIDCLAHAATPLANEEALTRALSAGRGRLNGIADATGITDEEIERTKDQVLGLVRSRYTMASEREVDELFGLVETDPALTTAHATSRRIVPTGAPAQRPADGGGEVDLDNILF